VLDRVPTGDDYHPNQHIARNGVGVKLYVTRMNPRFPLSCSCFIWVNVYCILRRPSPLRLEERVKLL
jgi:hypothetical protein